MSGEREDSGSSRPRPTPVAPSRGGEGERAFTVVFRGDLARLGLNPFATQSPYGDATRCGYGDAFDERDRMEAALQRIAEGRTPPDQHGHYLAHREAVRIAREALRWQPPDPQVPDDRSRDDIETKPGDLT